MLTVRQARLRYFVKNYDLYLLLLPGIIFFILFKYVPMYGITLAFKGFSLGKGIFGSEWVGLKHFEELFSMKEFGRVLINTLVISIYKLLFYFPVPIILALMLNEMHKLKLKKAIQTLIYLPYFLSWVVVAGLFINLLSPTGTVNQLVQLFGGESVSFLSDERYFRSVLVLTNIWKEAGWGTIIYLAALACINTEIYEAAIVDGAGKWRQAIHITLPGIAPTIIVLLILSLGGILEAGTEQILMLYSPLVYSVGDVLTTYVYRMGILQMQYSFTTAVGLFTSIVSFILIFFSNLLAKRISDNSIW